MAFVVAFCCFVSAARHSRALLAIKDELLLLAYLNAFRAFMIIAVLLTITGVICSVLGMRCTTVLEEEGKGKRWAVITGGVCHIISGEG